MFPGLHLQCCAMEAFLLILIIALKSASITSHAAFVFLLDFNILH